jgi:hypothetical protein
MSEDDAIKLSEVTDKFQKENSNPKYAYEYFHELNKHHFYLSVVREFEAFNGRAVVLNDPKL